MAEAIVRPTFKYAGKDKYANASVFTRFTLSWITPIISFGRRVTLNAPDMYAISPGMLLAPHMCSTLTPLRHVC